MTHQTFANFDVFELENVAGGQACATPFLFWKVRQHTLGPETLVQVWVVQNLVLIHLFPFLDCSALIALMQNLLKRVAILTTSIVLGAELSILGGHREFKVLVVRKARNLLVVLSCDCSASGLH